MKEFDEDYASNLNYLQRFSKEKKRNEYLEIYCIDAWSATDLIEDPEKMVCNAENNFVYGEKT